MRKVALGPEQNRLRSAALKLFRSTNPFDQPLRDEAKERLILTTRVYQLYEDEFEAIAYTARRLGETECAISEVEGKQVGEMERAEHWILDLNEFEAYKHIPLLMEYALYSLKGEWGLIVSHELHAVLGGSTRFMNGFKSAYPEWKKEREEFLELWAENRVKYGSDISWLPGLLMHVYGEVGDLPSELRFNV